MKVGALVSEYSLTPSIKEKAAFKIVKEKCAYNIIVRGN